MCFNITWGFDSKCFEALYPKYTVYTAVHVTCDKWLQLVTVLGVFVVSRVMIYSLQYPAELHDMSQV